MGGSSEEFLFSFFICFYFHSTKDKVLSTCLFLPASHLSAGSLARNLKVSGKLSELPRRRCLCRVGVRLFSDEEAFMFSLRLRSRVVAYCLAMAAAAAGGAAYGTTYNVTSDSTLSTALGEVVAGDTVVLANGNYAGFTVSRSGTAAAPITIKAATQGSAVITSGIVHLDACSFIIVQGLKVTTSGGTVSTDSTTRAVGVWFDAATDCEVTHSTFALDGA